MKTLVLLSSLLAFPAFAEPTDWCPIDGRNDATSALPSEARLSLSETGQMVVNFGTPSPCIQGNFEGGEYKCSDQVFATSLVPRGGGKMDEIGLDEVDLTGDLSNYELWLQREFNVYSEMQFQLCDGPTT